MSTPPFAFLRRRPIGDTLLLKFALVWVIPAVLLTLGELLATGAVSPATLALDAVAGSLLPFGVLALVIAVEKPPREGPAPEDGGDDGGGGPPRDCEPLPPSGGLSIDWDQFDADLADYARARELVV